MQSVYAAVTAVTARDVVDWRARCEAAEARCAVAETRCEDMSQEAKTALALAAQERNVLRNEIAALKSKVAAAETENRSMDMTIALLEEKIRRMQLNGGCGPGPANWKRLFCAKPPAASHPPAPYH